MDYENDKDAEDAMEALKGKNMGGRSLNIGKSKQKLDLLLKILGFFFPIYDNNVTIICRME